ncbi:MAG: DnaB-like helicase C-terminal domain-containing protein [Planctomycetota bacterium]
MRCAVTEMNDILEQPGSVDDMIEKIRAVAMDLQPVESGPDYVEMGKVATQVAVDMRDGPGVALETDYAEVDRLTGGFRPGESVILAARPAMGKTSLAMGMANNL